MQCSTIFPVLGIKMLFFMYPCPSVKAGVNFPWNIPFAWRALFVLNKFSFWICIWEDFSGFQQWNTKLLENMSVLSERKKAFPVHMNARTAKKILHRQFIMSPSFEEQAEKRFTICSQVSTERDFFFRRCKKKRGKWKLIQPYEHCLDMRWSSPMSWWKNRFVRKKKSFYLRDKIWLLMEFKLIKCWYLNTSCCNNWQTASQSSE